MLKTTENEFGRDGEIELWVKKKQTPLELLLNPVVGLNGTKLLRVQRGWKDTLALFALTNQRCIVYLNSALVIICEQKKKGLFSYGDKKTPN